MNLSDLSTSYPLGCGRRPLLAMYLNVYVRTNAGPGVCEGITCTLPPTSPGKVTGTREAVASWPMVLRTLLVCVDRRSPATWDLHPGQADCGV